MSALRKLGITGMAAIAIGSAVVAFAAPSAEGAGFRFGHDPWSRSADSSHLTQRPPAAQAYDGLLRIRADGFVAIAIGPVAIAIGPGAASKTSGGRAQYRGARPSPPHKHKKGHAKRGSVSTAQPASSAGAPGTGSSPPGTTGSTGSATNGSGSSTPSTNAAAAGSGASGGTVPAGGSGNTPGAGGATSTRPSIGGAAVEGSVTGGTLAEAGAALSTRNRAPVTAPPANAGTTRAALNNVPMVLAAGPWQGVSLRAAGRLSIPILFGLAVALFIILQALIDRRDPKLSRAPERGDDDTVGFE
jgi:hypothetical protein